MASTYNELYLTTKNRLRELGVEEAQLEARELVCHAVGKSREEFQLARFVYASQEMEERVAQLLARREAGEPVAYIIGEWEFYGMTLDISHDVLIPRPDTELLAERAIDCARRVGSSCRVMDLCAGSGCIGLAVASQVPGCRVVLADDSEAALKVAKKNVRRNGLKAQVSCQRADALEEPPAHMGSFNVIVSNPPYIRTGDIPGLDRSVREYEPHVALDGGPDGLDFYRSIAAKWKGVLRKGGWLLFEVGYDQAEDVARILEENSYSGVKRYQDSQGIWRVVEAQVSENQ